MGDEKKLRLERAVRLAYSTGESRRFRPPPSAPCFEPTPEDFADPLGYIAKIRPRVEPYGICKIRPPPRWRPPFSLDVDRLRFSPRVQKLNELQAVTRLRLHFEDRLCRFWDWVGDPLKRRPERGGKELNLFSLHHGVKMEGGRANCSWARVAEFCDFAVDAASLEFVRKTYDKILLPFDEAIAAAFAEDAPKTKKKDKSEDNDDDDVEFVGVVPARIEKAKTGSQKTASLSRELRRLACYGRAGPKMPGLCETSTSAERGEDDDPPKRPKRVRLDSSLEGGCAGCHDKRGGELLMCNGCSETYHPTCVAPKPERVTARWTCPACIRDELRRPIEPYGFAQSERDFSLQEFGEIADDFKSRYFGKAARDCRPADVEREFWRLAASVDDDVTVFYGADLHSMDHGSGFPTSSSADLSASDQEYVDSGWNLNNLPVLDRSVLNFINGAVSGMTVPWMYVGMCFSSFCWHNEDHWSYSINYLHWGEPKTWYGVPGASAEHLEESARAVAPELFRSQPDLLHQLVTIVDPNVLAEAGVPVYRADQRAGEFVVTFPRSYHAGFNQGYNFAEAVNFAPPDWLAVGRDAVAHYKSIGRLNVFSHDELLCKIGLSAGALDVDVALAAYRELVKALAQEKELRGGANRRGVRDAELRLFELLEDDRRLCDRCKTTCFLSAVGCRKCDAMMCLEHAERVCECPPTNLRLLYRYKLDEIHLMIEAIKERLLVYDKWVSEAKAALRPSPIRKDKAASIERLLGEAGALRLSQCPLLDRLVQEQRRCKDAEAHADVIEID